MTNQNGVPQNGVMAYEPIGKKAGERKPARSEAVQEIISRKPGFLERWAMMLFLLLLLAIFAGSWFIKYPDIVQARALLTASNSPREIISRADGRLVKLLAHNDDTVVQNAVIAWIESTGSHGEMIVLNSLLDSSISLLQNNKIEEVSVFFNRPFRDLGELQTNYQQFITAWQQFNDYLVNGYYYKRKKLLQEDLAFLKKMHTVTAGQLALTAQDLQLAKEGFDANSALYNDKIISKQDLRDQKSRLVGKQLGLPQLQSALLTNENQQANKQKDIDELEHSIAQQKIIFQQAIQTLKSLTDDWIKKYIIRSPVAGKLVFVIPVQENQFVSSGKILGFVNPGNSRYYAQVNLPQANFGKIDTGQKVQLRFDAYPYQEFGFVSGRLSYISKIPSDSGFLANIELPEGLTTNYKMPLQYRNGLRAQALIITRDARLPERLYHSLIKVTQR